MVDVAGPTTRAHGRWRLAWPPLAAGCAALVGAFYVALVDPNQPGHYLVCPTQALLGIDCPGCGGLRATHALMTGDLAAAADHNILLVVSAPVLVAFWFIWLLRRWRGDPPHSSVRWARLQQPVMVVVITLVAVFTVARNFVPYLGSGIG